MTLLAQVRRAGRVRRERTDWATVAVAVFVLAGLPVQVLVGVTTASIPLGSKGVPSGMWLGAGVLFGAMVFVSAMAIGPVRASQAEYTWVLSGPVDRRSELFPRWLRTMLATCLLGGVVGVAAAAIAGPVPALLASAGVIGAALAAALVGSATGLQGCSPPIRDAVRKVTTVMVIGGVAVSVVLTATGTSILVPAAVAIPAAVLAGVLAVLTTAWGWHIITTLDRVAVTSGNALFSATSAAVLFLEPGMLGDVLADRRLSSLRIRRSRSLPAGRARALLTAELLRISRHRRAVVLLVAALLGPYAAAQILPARWLPVVVLLCAVPAVSPFGSGFRRVCQSAALRRMLGGTDQALKLIHLVLPTATVVLFTLAAAPAVPPAQWVALALAPPGVIANLWLRTKGRPDVSGDRVGDFGFGPVPIDLVLSYVREMAVLAITVALQLVL